MTTASTAPQSLRWLGPQRRPLAVLLLTSLVSMVSNHLTALAVPWFVLVLTGSAGKMGLTAAATMLPSVLMMFVGGAIADRTRPRFLSIFSDVLSGVTVALVPLLYALGHLSFTWLLILMVAGALFDTPGYSARSKILPQLTERAGLEIEKVTSAQGMMQAASGLFGAILAGTLIGWIGATNVMWINAAAFGLSALVMLTMIPDMYVPREDVTSITDDIREGFRYVWNHDFLRVVMFGALAINALTVPIPSVLLPYTAKTVWDSAFWFGVVMSGFGAGALIGALLTGVLTEKISRSRIFQISLMLFALPTFLLVSAPGPVVAWCAVFGIGLGSGMINPVLMALMYRITDQSILGRVMGVISAGAMIASPAGVLLATPLLEMVGLGRSYLVFAVLMLATALVLMINPAMNRLDSIDAQEPASGEAGSQ